MEIHEEIVDLKTRLTLLEKKFDALRKSLEDEGVIRSADLDEE